jgi:hypothetical protein
VISQESSVCHACALSQFISGAGGGGDGELSATWAADPAVDLRLPPVPGNHVPLRTLAWQLHTYGTEANRPELPAWIEGPHRFPADQTGRSQAGRFI